jgi:cardiolipin synthase A/B
MEFFYDIIYWLAWIIPVLLIIINLIVAVKILLENRNPSKTAAYLLILLALPLIGLLIYFFFGENFRKRKIFGHKKVTDSRFYRTILESTTQKTEEILERRGHELGSKVQVARMIQNESIAGLCEHNDVTLLINGERKFPEVIKALESATHFIHLEYYIYEDDKIGNQIKDLLIRKSKEGVTVRFLYDDFGAREIRKQFVREMQAAGIETSPFYKTRFVSMANRINYRNHRKIIIVDGRISFVGGINVSDRYINDTKNQNPYYWRDTHLMIEGEGTHYLQYIFLLDWEFATGRNLSEEIKFYPPSLQEPGEVIQLVSSGPDSSEASVMLSYFKAINSATDRIFITTPYFIPNQGIILGLKQAAYSGVDVRLMVPGISDSRIVNAAAQSYYEDLLEAGVRIFLYQKGFVHAKTMVVDHDLSIVGTSNMDMRSFDYNFEVNAIIYGMELAADLAECFNNDLKDCQEIHLREWKKRGKLKRLGESSARLFSSLL